MISRLYQIGTLSLTLFTLSSVHAAVNIVECEDEDGNRSFQKVCPAGSSIVSEKKINIRGGSAPSKSSDIQAIIYVVPDCDTCSEVKEFLSNRNISITEKNVKEDIKLQKELTDLAGSLKVPTTVIGDETLSGYVRKDFINALKTVGYKESD